MSIARKDDRHNEDLVREISEGFNRAIGGNAAGENKEQSEDDSAPAGQPRFVVTGDQRDTGTKRRT